MTTIGPIVVWPTFFKLAEYFKMFSIVFSEGWVFFFLEDFKRVESTISSCYFFELTTGFGGYCLEHKIY
jgi:hypothetical protein